MGDVTTNADLVRVLFEVRSTDLRMGATNDPLDLAQYGRPFGLRTTFCGATSPEFRARVEQVGAGTAEYASEVLGWRDFPRYGARVIGAVRCLRRLRPDVVHINFAAMGPTLALAAHMLGIPIVARPGPYNARNPLNRWTDLYTAIAPAHASNLQDTAEAAKVRIVGPFVSTERLNQSELTAPLRARVRPGSVRFLFLGQLVERKGLDVLVRAFARMTQPNAELLLVGGRWEDDGYPRAIRQLATDLGVSDRVITENHRTDVGGLLRSADVFVLPSLSEAVPRCVLEALVIGLPIIASRVGGLPTVITHEETGLLVTPGHVDDLGLALDRLAGDLALCRRLASAGREWAQAHVSPSHTARRYVDVYREAIAARTGHIASGRG